MKKLKEIEDNYERLKKEMEEMRDKNMTLDERVTMLENVKKKLQSDLESKAFVRSVCNI